MEAKEGEGAVPLSTSINLHPEQGLFHPLSLPVFYWALPYRGGDAGSHNVKTEGSNVRCVGRQGKEGEEQEVSRSGRERSRDGWMNGGETRGRNSSSSSVNLNLAIKVAN